MKINDLRRPSELSETIMEINDLRTEPRMNANKRECSEIRSLGSAVVSTAVFGVSPNTSLFVSFLPKRGARRTPQRPRRSRSPSIKRGEKEPEKS